MYAVACQAIHTHRLCWCAPENGKGGWLQISPYVTELSLYDIAGTPGVAADISHINSRAITKVCRHVDICCAFPLQPGGRKQLVAVGY